MERYANFDLVIERDGDAYTARVIDSPAGEAANTFEYPFSRLEVDNFLLRVGQNRRTVRRIDSPQMEAAREFGGKLYETVFGGEVKTCFRRALDEADRQDEGLRVRVRFEGALDMADLPWEYLYSQGLGRFLVLSTRTPIVRYMDLPTRIRPLTVSPPLRILVMVSSPTDVLELDVDEEFRKLQSALDDLVRSGRVVIDRLDDANLSALQKRLRQQEYHIFHYIGHGGYDAARDDGVLMLEDAQGRGRAVSGHELGTVLHDHRTLRLAILNSCEGARSSTTDPFAGTAQSLVQQGIPAVVAMQFEISDDAAVVFAHEFYAAIADGYPVDAASAEARKAMFTANPDVEWGTPVLNMRSPDGMVFEVTGEPVPLPPELPKVSEPEPVDVEPEGTPVGRPTGDEPGQDEPPGGQHSPEADVPAEAGGPTRGADTERSEPAAPDDASSGIVPGPARDEGADPRGDGDTTEERRSAEPVPVVTVPAPKKGIPTVVWVIGAVTAALIILAIVGSLLPDDTNPPATEAGFVDPTAVDPPVTAAPPTAAPETVPPIVRPGQVLFATEIFDFDADGFPTWNFEPDSLAFTTFPVFSDGWDGVDDHETDWIFGWDDQFLYGQAIVFDDVYFQDQVGNQLFLGDSLNLDIDTDLFGDADNPAPDGDDFQVLISAASLNNASPEAWLFQGNGSIFVDASRQGGTRLRVSDESSAEGLVYVVEVAVPWSDLGISPHEGMELGFRVSATDNDVGFPVQEVMFSNVPDSSLFDVTSWGTLVLD